MCCFWGQSVNPLTALPFFFQMAFQHIMHIYMHSAKKAFSSLCIYLCTLFIIWCFHCGIASPWSNLESSRAVLAGGAWLWWSPLQHLPVQFACGKLRLVGEVFPFDSKFTVRGSLTRMWSRTPLKSAEGDFFRGLLFTFWKTRVWGRWNVYIASWRLFQIAHIYMHKAVKGLSKQISSNCRI